MPATKLIKSNCPSCKGKIQFEKDVLGQKTPCPLCGVEIELKQGPRGIMRWPAPVRWVGLGIAGFYVLYLAYCFLSGMLGALAARR